VSKQRLVTDVDISQRGIRDPDPEWVTFVISQFMNTDRDRLFALKCVKDTNMILEELGVNSLVSYFFKILFGKNCFWLRVAQFVCNVAKKFESPIQF
jgi:hypothetical protein